MPSGGKFRWFGFSFHDEYEPLRKSSGPETGISVRSSTIIWMNILRLVWKDCAMRIRRDFRSSLWNRYEAVVWVNLLQSRQRINSVDEQTTYPRTDH